MDTGMHGQKSNRRWVMLQRPGWNVATVGPVLMILFHAILWGGLGPEARVAAYHWGALSWGGMTEGRIWQVLTHIWLHGNWLHLVVNVALFYYAAARLSHFLSGRRILGLFLFCGVFSGLAHVLAQALFPTLPGLVGASGGLTGLLLGYFSISPESRMAFFHISAGNLSKGILIASALLFLMSPMLDLPAISSLGHLMEGLLGPGIFQSAHLVHFIGGLMGWRFISKFLPPLLSRNDLIRMRLEQEVGTALR